VTARGQLSFIEDYLKDPAVTEGFVKYIEHCDSIFLYISLLI